MADNSGDDSSSEETAIPTTVTTEAASSSQQKTGVSEVADRAKLTPRRDTSEARSGRKVSSKRVCRPKLLGTRTVDPIEEWSEEEDKDGIIIISEARMPPEALTHQLVTEMNLQTADDIKFVTDKIEQSRLSLVGPKTSREYKCNWCGTAGYKSQRLTCQYDQPEWGATVIRLCFECVQGDFTEAEKIKDNTKFFNSDPDDFNECLMQELSLTDIQDYAGPLIRLGAGKLITNESPTAAENSGSSHACLPKVRINTWKINLRPYQAVFPSLTDVVTKLPLVSASVSKTVMYPPLWMKDHWHYYPMYDLGSIKKNNAKFRADCKQAHMNWDAAWARTFQLNFRSVGCAESMRREGLDKKDLRKAGVIQKLMNYGQYAVVSKLAFPPLPKMIGETHQDHALRLSRLVQRINATVSMFQDWDKFWEQGVGDTKAELAKNVFSEGNLLDYVSKITEGLNEYYVCRACGHFGPPSQWAETTVYHCPHAEGSRQCAWRYHMRNTTSESYLLAGTHVWVVDNSITAQMAGAPGTSSGPLTDKDRQIMSTSESEVIPEAWPSQALSGSSQTLGFSGSSQTPKAIGITSGNIEAGKNYQFYLVNYAEYATGEKGKVRLDSLINEMKIIWNDLSVEMTDRTVEKTHAQVFDVINKQEQAAYFTKHVVDNDYAEKLTLYLKNEKNMTKTWPVTNEHWPIDDKEGKRFFLSASIDMKTPKTMVMDWKDQLRMFGMLKWLYACANTDMKKTEEWVRKSNTYMK